MPTFNLTPSNDTFPQSGVDTSGNDSIYGLEGADEIAGGLGNDYIDGGIGHDTLTGGSGNDTIVAGTLPLDDVMDGGIGHDLAVVEYQNVKNVATNVSVRVVAQFSEATWGILIDGIIGTTLTGFEQVEITSGNADDYLTAGSGNDTLTSLGGNDRLYGGTGDDVIRKTWGRYDLRGGDGFDTLWVANTGNTTTTAALVFDARAALGTVTTGAVTSGTFRHFEAYNVVGTQVNDTIHLGDGADTVFATEGRDLINGYGGADRLDGGAGADTVFGGAGNDDLQAGEPASTDAASADQIYGGDGDDRIYVATTITGGTTRTYSGVVFDGGAGTDRLEIQGLLSGIVDLSGATLTGIERIEYSTGFTGGIVLSASQFNSLSGFATPGFVRIATAGEVTAHGVLSMASIQLFDGGQKFNMGNAERPFSDYTTRVNGGTGNDTILGAGRRDALNGGDGNDSLFGSGANDVLSGGAGVDTLLGGTGNDVLVGGSGGDRMAGGDGADTFQFFSTTESGVSGGARDRILGFTVDPAAGAGFVDRIDLGFPDASTTTPGTQSFSFVGGAAFSAEGQVRVAQSGLDTLVSINTTGTTGAEMVIILQGVTAASLTASDFIL